MWSCQLPLQASHQLHLRELGRPWTVLGQNSRLDGTRRTPQLISLHHPSPCACLTQSTPGSSMPVMHLSARCGQRLGALPRTSGGIQATRTFISLERATGLRAGADDVLWKSGMFTAGVYPDLPAITKLQQLFRAPQRYARLSAPGYAGPTRVDSVTGVAILHFL